MGYEWDILSGSVKIAIEMAIEIVSFPIKNGDVPLICYNVRPPR